MRELIQLLPVIVIILAVVSMIRNAAKMVRKAGEQRPASQQRSPADYDPALAERTRRIQEEIRRKIAERRGIVLAPEPFPAAGAEPPVMATDDRVERGYTAADSAVLERQERLAAQMRALELARMHEQRRAVQVTANLKAESESERGLLTGSRGELLAGLRDPAGLRRALVLREVLGPPVGLR